MGNLREEPFGDPFERLFVACIALAAGLTLVFLAIQGPLVRGVITYKTAPGIMGQLAGQDAVNLGLLAPLLIIGAIGLFLRKAWAKSPPHRDAPFPDLLRPELHHRLGMELPVLYGQ